MPKELARIDRSVSLQKLLQDRDDLLSHVIDAMENEDLGQQEIALEVLDEIILPALAVKFDGLAHTIKFGLPSKIEELKAWKDAISTKQKVLENTLEAIKQRLKYYHAIGKVGDVMEGEISSITISDGSLSVDDSQSDPNQWASEPEWKEYVEVRVEYKINKRKILEDYKAGKLTDDDLPPGITIKNGSRLTVRIKDS